MSADVPSGWSRRELVAALPLVWAGLSAGRALAQGLLGPIARWDDYCGVFTIGDRAIGIDRFINDAGAAVLFYADYTSSLVRPLADRGGDNFVMRPPGGISGPDTLNAHFVRDDMGVVRQLVVRPTDGAVFTATRAPGRHETVRFASESAELAGTLMLPSGEGPYPAIVLLHGSGPLTRYSFGPYPRFFNALGLAVLVFDKRGTGASSGRRLDASTGAPTTLWPDYYPSALLADAHAAVAWLRAHPEVDPTRVGAWGSSEGGMLATQLPSRDPSLAFAINSSGFMGPLWQTLYYQGGALLRSRGASESELAEADVVNRLWIDVARTGHGYDAFIARRAELLAAGKKRLLYYVSEVYSSRAQMRWSWDHVLSFDSTRALPKAGCPVLGLFGAADLLTDAPRAAQALREGVLKGGNRDVTTHIVPDATHSLMATSKVGMAPSVFPTLRDWLDIHNMLPN